VGRAPSPLLPPWAGYHWASSPIHLQPCHHLEENRMSPLSVYGQKFTTGDHPSAPPVGCPFHRLALSSPDPSGEHLSVQCPKLGSPSHGLAPWPLLSRPLSVGRLESAREAASADGDWSPLLLGHEPKGRVGWATLVGPAWEPRGAEPNGTVPFFIFLLV
jgi:hypothetical protein